MALIADSRTVPIWSWIWKASPWEGDSLFIQHSYGKSPGKSTWNGHSCHSCHSCHSYLGLPEDARGYKFQMPQQSFRDSKSQCLAPNLNGRSQFFFFENPVLQQLFGCLQGFFAVLASRTTPGGCLKAGPWGFGSIFVRIMWIDVNHGTLFRHISAISTISTCSSVASRIAHLISAKNEVHTTSQQFPTCDHMWSQNQYR